MLPKHGSHHATHGDSIVYISVWPIAIIRFGYKQCIWLASLTGKS